MENQNIVFQAIDRTEKDLSWHNTKITYVLLSVPSNYNGTDIVDAIYTMLGYYTIKTSEKLKPDTVCKRMKQ